MIWVYAVYMSMCVYIHMCEDGLMHATAYTWSPEDNLKVGSFLLLWGRISVLLAIAYARRADIFQELSCVCLPTTL